MLDIRLDDSREHQLERDVDSAMRTALLWEKAGDKLGTEYWLNEAVKRENELIAFRRERIDRLIDR